MDFNLADINEAVAAAVGDREAIVYGDLRLTYRQLRDRSRQLGHVLADAGLGVRAERGQLQGWQSGQDHLALYLHNGNEYLEGMLGAYQARVAPFNVNYRYVAEELRYLLADCRGPGRHLPLDLRRRPCRPCARTCPSSSCSCRCADDSGHDLLPGARWYEEALADAPTTPLTRPGRASPDDLYILYTGGTTGMPKGVLWRQHDIFPAAMGGRDLGTGLEWPDLETIVETARNGGAELMPIPPFMHGAAHWLAFNALCGGNTIVIPARTQSLDPALVWSTIEAEQVNILLIVGDAFGRPLLDELDRHPYELGSLLMMVSGGAALSAPVKSSFLAQLPNMGLLDGRGVGDRPEATQISGAASPVSTGTFTPGPGMAIVDENLTRVLEPGLDRIGLAGPAGSGAARLPGRRGQDGPHLPGHRRGPLLGAGRPGPLHAPTAMIDLQGRDSVTINSGGEKIFAEEVEAALMAHPAVYDAVVAGRPSERWGKRWWPWSSCATAPPPPPTSCWPRARSTWPATSCPSTSCWSTRWCAPPPARPTTAGPASKRSTPTDPDTS